MSRPLFCSGCSNHLKPKNSENNNMRLLPESSNHEYHGVKASIWFLFLLAIITIIPACIHTFLPDGGAGVIAKLDLTHNGPLIIKLFAWAGTTQLVWGLMTLVVAVRFRNLAPLMLLLFLVERSLHAYNMWLGKAASLGGHHPPEAYATLVMVPLIALFLFLSLTDKKA